MYSLDKIAKGFAAIGSEQRLTVYLLLVRKCKKGVNIKELQEMLDIKPSTLAHHLKFLVEADLVIQKKNGKEILNFPNLDTLDKLYFSIKDECCKLEYGESC